jgi:hypothetical protein
MASALRPVAKQSQLNELFLVEMVSNLMADTKRRACSVLNYIRPPLFNDAETDYTQGGIHIIQYYFAMDRITKKLKKS